jgi:hypothetical protein
MIKLLMQIFMFLAAGISINGYAQSVVVGGAAPSAGDVASNMTSATDMFGGLLGSACYVIGIALVTASIMQYREYKLNPSQTPISRPILLLVCGLIIGFLPVMGNFLTVQFAPYNV